MIAAPRLSPALRSASLAVAGVAALVGLALLLAMAPLSLAAALVLGGIGAVALLLRPAMGLCLLALAVPYGATLELQLGGLRVSGGHLALLAVGAAWLAQGIARRRLSLGATPLAWGLAAYLATLLLGLLPAQQLLPALKEVLKWSAMLAVALLAPALMAARDTRLLAAAVLLAAATQAALGAVQFLSGAGPEGFVLLGRFMRAYGSFGQPNPYAGYLGLSLPLTYGLALGGWPRALAWLRGEGEWADAALWLSAVLACPLLLAGIVLSWSRGALLGVVAGAGLALLAILPRRALAPTPARRAVAMVLALVLLVAPVAGPRLASRLPTGWLTRLTDPWAYATAPDPTAIEITDESFAVVERAAQWLAAWRMFDSAPWLGVGTGQYEVVYPQVALPRWSQPMGHAHNQFLHALAEGGLLGLAGYLAWMIAALATAWRAARRVGGMGTAWGLAALGVVGHLLVHGLFDSLYVREIYLQAMLVLAVAGAFTAHAAPLRPEGG